MTGQSLVRGHTNRSTDRPTSAKMLLAWPTGCPPEYNAHSEPSTSATALDFNEPTEELAAIGQVLPPANTSVTRDTGGYAVVAVIVGRRKPLEDAHAAARHPPLQFRLERHHVRLAVTNVSSWASGVGHTL